MCDVLRPSQQVCSCRDGILVLNYRKNIEAVKQQTFIKSTRNKLIVCAVSVTMYLKN